MKITKNLPAIIIMLFIASCGHSSENTTTTPPEPATETSSQGAHSNTKAKEDPDHTEIGIDQNGVKYSKKSGSNETDVKIKTDSGSISIRKRK